MKKIQKFVSVCMAVILLITGIVPVYAENMRNKSIYGGQKNEMSDMPAEVSKEKIQHEGEWSYWLYDNYAIIAGYANKQATFITVPENLNGHVVVGIGKKAFSTNVGLDAVEISVFVKQIADDAFEGLSEIQIYSYNGAYALQYGNEHGLSVHNKSYYDFNEQVVDLTGISRQYYHNLTENSVMLDSAVASLLKTDDIIYFPGTNGVVKDGAALQINSISSTGSEAVLTMNQPYIGMVFDSIHAEEAIRMDWAHAEYAEGVVPEGDVGASASSVSFGFDLANLKVFKKWGIKGGGQITVGPASAKADIRWKRALPSGCDVQVNVPVKTASTVEISYEFYKKESRLEPRMTLAKVPIASNGVFSGYVTIDMVVAFDGKIKITSSTSYNFMFTLKNGKASANYSKGSNMSVQGSANVKVGPKVALYFVLGIANFALRIIEVETGMYAKVSVSVEPKRVSAAVPGASNLVFCGTYERNTEVGVTLKIGLIKIGKKGGPYASLSFTKTEKKGSGHTDLAGPLGICTLKNRKITYDSQLKGNNRYKHATCNVNMKISEPAHPTRKGYKFAGWYINMAKSGFVGSDYKWNFSSGLMPYAFNQGTVFFYAKWTKLPAGQENEGEDGFPGATSNPNNPYKASVSYGDSVEKPEIAPPTYVDPGTHELVVPVSRIELDKNNITTHSRSDKKTEKITARVYPDNAKDKSVEWFSSNDEVAVVDAAGNITIKGAGSANITCRSKMINSVTSVCTVKVVQYVEEVGVVADKYSLIPGDSCKATAYCFPLSSTDPGVTWTSDNEKIVKVDQNGTVQAVGYGKANVIATSKDGSNVSGKTEIIVEKELSLECDMTNDTFYLQGGPLNQICLVRLTNGSLERMKKRGYKLEWSLAGNSDIADVTMDISQMKYELGDASDITDFVYLNTEQLKCAGAGEYTVICKAGPYTEECKIPITVSDKEFSKNVKLQSAVYYGRTGETIVIEPELISQDSKLIPENMDVTIVGDDDFKDGADEKRNEKNIELVFNKSSVYQAYVNLSCSNIVYQIPVVFYIKDENGIVHIPVSEITLDNEAVRMIEGEKLKLNAELVPSDAYDKTVEWITSDSDVATVDKDGVVSAVGSGNAMIVCKAKDGSNIEAYCSVNVESFLCLDEDKIDLTVYKQGRDHVALSTVNLTYLSEVRLQQSDLNVTWNISRVSGNSTEVALNEYESLTGENFAVSGNQIELLRMNDIGEDEYLLTCKAGKYTDSCKIHIKVIDDSLPEQVKVRTTSYRTKTGKSLVLDSVPVCIPSQVSLPGDAVFSVDGNNVFMNALSEEYDPLNPKELHFKKAGRYEVKLIWKGTNYQYTCPIQIEVQDEKGNIPTAVESIDILPEKAELMPGESIRLKCNIEPEDSEHGSVKWECYDNSIATVSNDGTVTALKAGTTIVTAMIEESEEVGMCVLYVENGLTMQEASVEKTVFVDGETRTPIMDLMLTESSSKRITEVPQWELKRVSGNSLTLRTKGIETRNDEGLVLYGCRIELYSISKLGDTIYDLYCKSGKETAITRIVIHSMNRDDILPSTLTFSKTQYEANIDELITVNQEVVCWPENCSVPDGFKVRWNGDKQYLEALKADDFRVSQSLSTFAFSTAGTYEAECMYSYSNITYRIPVTFRIRNRNGTVPVQARELKMDKENIYLVTGEKNTLKTVFTPANTTDKVVSWKSLDTSVAIVDELGNVTAVGNGMTTIVAVPSDERCNSAKCAVTVENAFSLDAGSTENVLYLQGEKENDIAVITLSEGTKRRLENKGLSCEWTLNTENVVHSEMILKELSDQGGAIVSSTALKSGGEDIFTVTCKAGTDQWTQQYHLKIMDLGRTAPDTVTSTEDTVKTDLNTPVTVDFKPICIPASARIPEDMTSYYVGLGEFYDALDYSVYRENGNQVTMAFTKPGRYILTRQYFLNNLRYTISCVIVVGAVETDNYRLLSADHTNSTMYEGGKSGAASVISLKDAMISDVWSDSIEWKINRISGNSMDAKLKRKDDSEVELFVTDVDNEGTDIWRVSCTFGSVTDSIDITINAVKPRGILPESIELSHARWRGVIGNWIMIPLGVSCYPQKSILPDAGDEFWNFKMEGYGRDVAEACIVNNFLKVRFSENGYYNGGLTYQSGNVSYDIKIDFVIEDEEGTVIQNCLIYPKNLQKIDEEAFENDEFELADLRGTAITMIGARAFKDCTNLKKVYIPDTVNSIGEDAFYGCTKITIYCNKGTCADFYAQKNGIKIQYLNQ